MSNVAKASRPRYQKIRELGHNRLGGRVTYLASDNAIGQLVVIKQFQFATSGSDWSAFKAYDREIQVLASLNHSGIPRYLNSFETSTGFCLVQEYKEAESLGVSRSFAPSQIQQIAISVLEILVYLQSQTPPIIHRDIKPENILVDDQLNVYLVDFGFARIGSGEGGMSSVAAGTFGFMAPEQLYNRQQTTATDLYGLGATLICLLTGTKSTEIETLIDDKGRINYQLLVGKFHPHFIDWLAKMVEPKQKERYTSASEAKAALIPLSIAPIPKVHITQSSLLFKSTKLDEKVTQTLTVSNEIPDTILEGSWEVVPHPNDPPALAKHTWISCVPVKFQRNKIECSVTVDTSKLLVDKAYIREIILQTNANPKTYKIMIEVHTASLPIIKSNSLTFLIFCTLLLSVFTASALRVSQGNSQLFPWLFTIALYKLNPYIYIIGAMCWFMIGVRLSFSWGIVATTVAAAITWWFPDESLSIVYYDFMQNWLSFLITPILIFVSSFKFLISGILSGLLFQEQRKTGFNLEASVVISILATVTGSCLGIGMQQGEFSPLLIVIAISSSLGIVALILYQIQQRQKLIDKYLKSKPYRITPY